MPLKLNESAETFEKMTLPHEIAIRRMQVIAET